MKGKTVSICCFADGLQEYADDRALVAVDVIRATTTAVTAISMGRECHLVPTLAGGVRHGVAIAQRAAGRRTGR